MALRRKLFFLVFSLFQGMDLTFESQSVIQPARIKA